MSLPNLRLRDAWKPATHPKSGEKAEDVIETLDGLFTIVKTWSGIPSQRKPVYLAWRRREKSTADFLGGFPEADAARDAVARCFERMASP